MLLAFGNTGKWGILVKDIKELSVRVMWGVKGGFANA